MSVRRVVAHFVAERPIDTRRVDEQSVAGQLRQELADVGCDMFGPVLVSEFSVQVEGYQTEEPK